MTTGQPIEPTDVGEGATAIVPVHNLHYDAGGYGGLMPTEVSVPNEGTNPKLLDVSILH